MKILGENADEGNFSCCYIKMPLDEAISKVGFGSGSESGNVLMLMVTTSLGRTDLFFSVSDSILQILEGDES